MYPVISMDIGIEIGVYSIMYFNNLIISSSICINISMCISICIAQQAAVWYGVIWYGMVPHRIA